MKNKNAKLRKDTSKISTMLCKFTFSKGSKKKNQRRVLLVKTNFK